MERGEASGLQIAFLVFAVMLLSVPAMKWVASFPLWSREAITLLEKAFQFLVAGLLLIAVPALRRICVRELQRAPTADARSEAVLVAVAALLIPMAWAGGLAIWRLTIGGETHLAQFIAGLAPHEMAMQQSLSAVGIARALVLPVLVGPIIEELVFRGLLYRAWERQMGWIPALLATSAMFAVYHTNFAVSFVSSVIYVCLLRRTGTLWAPIIAHAIYNFLIFYPFIGQFVLPRDAIAPGDLSSWNLQLACLLIAAIALPTYVWMARHKREPIEDFPPTVVDAAVSK